MSEFLDHLKLTLRAGRGGNGCVSFRREKFVPLGGPNGGSGGRGGHVIFVADSGHNTLAHLRPNALIRAERGKHGEGKNRTGAQGDDTRIPVPLGTIIRDAETGEMLAELLEAGQEEIIAEGGRGGRGNASFSSSTHQTPRFATEGKPGEERKVELELKLLADVGIIGLPNAGKSTLTSRISAAKPAVADYPFTTLYPVLGVIDLGWESFVIADIPGLIEGAHKGVGLGHKFLRHIERCRCLLHLVDIGSPDAPSPAEQAAALDNELRMYRVDLTGRPQLIVGNKIDLNPSADRMKELETFAKSRGARWCFISGATSAGVDEMLRMIAELLKESPRDLSSTDEEEREE